MNLFRNLFSGQLAGILCTLISILAINCIQITIPNLGWDNSFSIAAAKNLSEGHGYSIRLACPEDISKACFEPLNKWPPGYSFLLLLVHTTGFTDWIQAAFLLNAIGLTLLVLLFRKTMLQLEYPPWITHITVLYFGFVFHVFLGIYFSDIFALLFFMTGVSLLLQYVKGEQRNFYLVIVSSFFFSFSSWQKYSYLGLAFIPMISFFYFGFRKRDKTIQRIAALAIGIAGMLISLLLYYQYKNSGGAIYIKHPTHTGFYPSQLLELTPIIPESFLNLNFVNMQISNRSAISYQSMTIVWSVVNVICLCFVIVISWPIIKNDSYFKKAFKNYYALMSLWVCFFVFIFLGFLTARYNSHYDDMTNSWVYIASPRYFAPFCFLIFEYFAYLYLTSSLFPKKQLSVLFRFVMICIILEEISHGTYFIFKQVLIKEEFGLHRRADQKELRSSRLVNVELEKKDELIISAGLPEISNFNGLSGTSSIADLSLFRKPLYSSKEVLIITTLDSFLKAQMPPEFFKLDTRLVEQKEGYSYYFTRIHPKN